MKKLFRKISLPALAFLAAPLSALAEGEAASGIDATLVTGYITEGKTAIIAVLTAGAVIIGAFFVWRLIKRALNNAK